MSAPLHEIFGAIREDVLDHLAGASDGVDGADQGGADGAEQGGGPSAYRAQVGSVVAKMQRFIETGDLGRYREFVHRWAAMRLGEGSSPESILHAVTAIGDTVIRFSHDRDDSRLDFDAFARDVARASLWATRLVVEVLAEELKRREREHRKLVEGGLG